MLVIEEILDRVARAARPAAGGRARAQPLPRRRARPTRTHYGEEIGDNRIQAIWRRRWTQARFAERRRGDRRAGTRAHPRVKRGLAVTPVKFGISFTAHVTTTRPARWCYIYQDGTVQVNHGGTEMGQGLHTKMLGVAMRELGLPADAHPGDDDAAPTRCRTPRRPRRRAAPTSTARRCAAACETLRERLAPVAAEPARAAKSGDRGARRRRWSSPTACGRAIAGAPGSHGPVRRRSCEQALHRARQPRRRPATTARPGIS